MSETIFGKELELNESETEIKMGKIKANIYLGDCLDVLKRIERNTVDLIVTSPPYADSREKTYGGIKPDKYVNWFLSRSAEFLRVLKPTGTFILNIKERVANGERHTYVLDLIIKLREQGWLWTEEFIWHKRNCHPGKWPNRFRDAWERLLQFNKSRHFAMYQNKVMVPIGEWAKTRLKHLGKNDVVRFDSQVKSGFGKNISNWIGREMAYPSNVLYMATETRNEQHSAVFPRALPEWFIKLFTKENDLVLDPFLGSGTVLEIAYQMNRNSIGIESVKGYYHLAKKRLAIAMKRNISNGKKVEKDVIRKSGKKEFSELVSSV